MALRINQVVLAVVWRGMVRSPMGKGNTNPSYPTRFGMGLYEASENEFCPVAVLYVHACHCGAS